MTSAECLIVVNARESRWMHIGSGHRSPPQLFDTLVVELVRKHNVFGIFVNSGCGQVDRFWILHSSAQLLAAALLYHF